MLTTPFYAFFTNNILQNNVMLTKCKLIPFLSISVDVYVPLHRQMRGEKFRRVKLINEIYN